MQIQTNGEDACVGIEAGIQTLGSRSLEDLCGVIIEVAGEEDGENENDDDDDDDDDDDEEDNDDDRESMIENSMMMNVTI